MGWQLRHVNYVPPPPPPYTLFGFASLAYAGHVESWEGQRRIAFFVNSMYMKQPEVSRPRRVCFGSTVHNDDTLAYTTPAHCPVDDERLDVSPSVWGAG